MQHGIISDQRRSGARAADPLSSSGYVQPVNDAIPGKNIVEYSMVGNNPKMLEVFEQIRRFATHELPVLITGESGTGKELVARALHERSRRSAGPNVALNCTAMPSSLIASELFGYEKGTFTGAMARRAGYIEHASGGTLFLDEIGDMAIDVQGHLLRFLQEGEVIRLGGRKPIKVDVRVIAATNVHLEAAIAAGRFREDLFYRLNVLTIHMPPLRDRDDDIELMATVFLRQIGSEFGRRLEGFTPAAMEAMRDHEWPGNVRELIATLRRAVVLSKGDLIDEADLKLKPHPPRLPRTEAALGAPVAQDRLRPSPGSEAERTTIRDALEKADRNVTRAARTLGVSRVTFYRMLRRTAIVTSTLDNDPNGAAPLLG